VANKSLAFALTGLFGCALALGGCSGVPESGVTDPKLYPLESFEYRISGRSIYDRPEDGVQRFISRTTQRENFIAACMKEQGFTYYPDVDTPTITIHESELDLGSREFAELYGFGISTNAPRDGTTMQFDSPSEVDSNAELKNSMSPQELEAWQTALWGTLVEGVWSPETGGCSGTADRLFATPAEFSHVESEIRSFRATTRTMNSSDFDSVNREWSHCMLNRGFAVPESPALLVQTITEEFAVLRGLTVRDDGSISGQIVTPESGVIDSFSRNELAIAVASWDCRDSVNYSARAGEILRELEQEFVDNHRFELESWEHRVNEVRNQTP